MVPPLSSAVPARSAPWPRSSSESSASGVDDVPDDQPDRQGDGRHGQEVGQREAADPAHAGGLSQGADAEHDRAEDDRADEHPDQRHEGGTEPLHADGEFGEHETDDDAQDHGHDDRDVEPVRSVALGGPGRRVRGIVRWGPS
jgi:hypothetical protein